MSFFRKSRADNPRAASGSPDCTSRVEDPLDTPWKGTDLDPRWCLLEASFESWERVWEAESGAQRGVDTLAALGRSDDEVGRSARHRLRLLALASAEAASRSRTPRTRVTPPTRRAWGKGYMLVGRASPETRIRAYRELVAGSAITLVGSLAAAVSVALGAFAFALAIVILRIALSTLINQPPQFPDDDANRGARESLLSFRSTYFGCIFLHVGDLLTLAGVCVFLAVHDHPWRVLAVAACGVLALFGSFARTGAMTVGVRVPRRMTTERFARLGGCVVGMGLALVTGDPRLIALCGVGFAFYGLVELWVTVRDVYASSATAITTVVRSDPDSADVSDGSPIREVVTTAPRPGGEVRNVLGLSRQKRPVAPEHPLSDLTRVRRGRPGSPAK